MSGSKRSVLVNGERFHERILTDTHSFAVEVQGRLKEKDSDIKIFTTEPKHIYVYYLDKRLKNK